jgi:hypothetical protein
VHSACTPAHCLAFPGTPASGQIPRQHGISGYEGNAQAPSHGGNRGSNPRGGTPEDPAKRGFSSFLGRRAATGAAMGCTDAGGIGAARSGARCRLRSLLRDRPKPEASGQVGLSLTPSRLCSGPDPRHLLASFEVLRWGLGALGEDVGRLPATLGRRRHRLRVRPSVDAHGLLEVAVVARDQHVDGRVEPVKQPQRCGRPRSTAACASASCACCTGAHRLRRQRHPRRALLGRRRGRDATAGRVDGLQRGGGAACTRDGPGGRSRRAAHATQRP